MKKNPSNPAMDTTDRRNWMYRYHAERSRRIAVVRQFWSDINDSRWDALPKYFTEEAHVDWVCTSERFTVEEFVSVMKHYPGGKRLVTLQKMEAVGNKVATAVEIRQPQTGETIHVTAFFTFTSDKIRTMEEYRTDGHEVPLWRQEMHLGTAMPAQQSLALKSTL